MREYFINKGDGFLAHAIANRSATTKDIGFTEIMRTACVGERLDKVYKDENDMSNVVDTETTQFPYAWGLNAFFKEWVTWFEDLSGKDARRTFTIFPNTAKDIDQNNVTQKFFSENKFGIATTEQRREGGFFGFGGQLKEVGKYPDIATSILKAHNKNKWSNVPEEKKLAALLKTVSDGLDEVINNTCAL